MTPTLSPQQREEVLEVMTQAVAAAYPSAGRGKSQLRSQPLPEEVYSDLAAVALSAALPVIRRAVLEEAALAAYDIPAYVAGFEPDSRGRLLPASPCDRGRYDAANAILALAEEVEG